MTLTPEARAAKELFGFAEYVPTRPHQTYSPMDDGVRVSYAELVARYEQEGRRVRAARSAT